MADPDEIGQRLFLTHGRFGEHIDTRLLGAAGDAQAGNDVLRLDPADRLDIEERLADQAGEQQLGPADGQPLAIGAIAAVLQLQLATGIRVVADMQVTGKVGGEAEAGEAQAIRPTSTSISIFTASGVASSSASRPTITVL